jgi:predicted TIM-barrel fold metal-dependent hydrolase
MSNQHSSYPPTGACDCHVHVIGPRSRYPLNPTRSYTPADAPLPMLVGMLEQLCLDRAVVVQPSVFGTDNACTLDAIDALGHRGRGVAVVSPTTDGSELDAMHRRGIRGVRINIVSGGPATLDTARTALRATVSLCARNGWHVQLYLRPDLLVALTEDFAGLPVPVVFDHFGLLDPDRVDETAVAAVTHLMQKGCAWTKLSGTYRISSDPFAPAIAHLARRIYAVNPERTVWGSDWPHTPEHKGQAMQDDRETPYRDMDTCRLLQDLRVWFPSDEDQRRILVANPEQLYDFPRASGTKTGS